MDRAVSTQAEIASDSVRALAERADDVLPLARAFLGPERTLTPGAEDALLAHAWPGNVRELANCIQRAKLLARSSQLDVADLGLPVSEAEPIET